MQIPDDIVTHPIALKDQYFDLPGISHYTSMKPGTIRDHITGKAMPCFKVGGKLLFRRSEVDRWIEQFRHTKSQDLAKIVDDIMDELKG